MYSISEKEEIKKNLFFENYLEIKKYSETGLKKEPKDLYYLVNLLYSNQILGLENENEEILNEISKIEPKTGEEYYCYSYYYLYLQKPNEAFQFLLKSCDLNYPEALLNMGKLYLQNKDEKNGLEFLKKSFNLGNQESKLQIANYYLEKEPLKGYLLLKDLEKSNQISCDYYLYQAFNKGIGIKDKDIALNHLSKSANMGDTRSQFELAIHFLNQKNFKESFQWLNKSVENGNIKGEPLLAIYYLEGYGADQNIEKATEILLKSIQKHNNDESRKVLAHQLIKGKYLQEDYSNAAALYSQCANNGDQLCPYFLGMCYIHGLGVEQNLEFGKQLILQSSMAHRFRDSLDQLSNLYPQEWDDQEEDEEEE